MKINQKLIILFFACLVGLFNVLPFYFSYTHLANNFQGVWREFNGDTLYYLSRVNDVLDGHEKINHPYFIEHKDIAYPQATLAERFVAFGAKLFNAKVYNLQVVLSFISPAIIFILSYILFFQISKSRFWSILLPFSLYTMIAGVGMMKPINPQITFPLLLIFLIFYQKAVIKLAQNKLNFIVAGIAFGLLFLTYFYHWSFLLVLLGLYSVFLIAKKDYKRLKIQLKICSIAFIIGLPYFWLIFKGINAPFHDETMARVGVYFSHWPETWPRLLVGLFWFLSFGALAKNYKILKNLEAQFILSLLAANITYPNHQIISGTIIQNANHWSFMPIFIYALSLAYGLKIITEKKDKQTALKIKLIQAFFIFIFMLPSFRLASFTFPAYLNALKPSQEEKQIQRYSSIFEWLNQNTLADSVVLANLRIMNFIPVYTNNNVYYHNYAFNLPGSDQEILERAILANFFNKKFFEDKNFGMSEDERILWTQPAQSERNANKIYDVLGINYKKQYSLAKEKEKTLAVYNNLFKNGYNIELLNKYQLDYIIWDQELSADWDINQYTELEKIYEKNNIIIYSFKKCAPLTALIFLIKN